MTKLSTSPKSRPSHRRGTSSLLFLALAALLALLQTTAAKTIWTCPSGAYAQVGDIILFQFSYSIGSTVIVIDSVGVSIICSNSRRKLYEDSIINNDQPYTYTIPSDVVSTCDGSNQVYVEYELNLNVYPFTDSRSCPVLTILAATPTTSQPSSSSTAFSSSATAPTLITTALPSTSLVPPLSKLTSKTKTDEPSPNAALSTNISSSPPTTGNVEDQTNKSGSSKNTTVVALGTVGGIAALVFVVFGLVAARRRHQRNRRRLSSLGDGYPMKYRSDDGYGGGGYEFGSTGRGHVHSEMTSETTGQLGYGDYGQNTRHSHNRSHSNNNNNNINHYGHRTRDTYDYNYGEATPAVFYPYHDPMAATTAVAVAGTGYVGNGASDLNEYLPPPPVLIPTAVARLPARPELSFKEEYSSSSWEQRPTAVTTALSTPTSKAAATGAIGAHRIGGYGLDKDPHGGHTIDKKNLQGSLPTLNNNTKPGRDYPLGLRQSIAKTAAEAGGADRDSAVDTGILPEMPSSERGVNGFSYPVPPTVTAPGAALSSLSEKTVPPWI